MLLTKGQSSRREKIPQTLTDRYARINHGFTDHCHNYVPKPPACKLGSQDAQSAAAWSHVGLSALLLLVNPIISSLSDIHGRKPAILLALLLSCIPAFVFYLIIVRPEMSPAWYYVSFCFEHLIKFYVETLQSSILLRFFLSIVNC